MRNPIRSEADAFRFVLLTIGYFALIVLGSLIDESVGGAELLETIRSHVTGRTARVLVVCPALNSPLRHWASDEDDARRAAQERLERSLESMRAAGIDADGQIGDGD